MYGEINLQHS